jgi:hypothetical protein
MPSGAEQRRQWQRQQRIAMTRLATCATRLPVRVRLRRWLWLQARRPRQSDRWSIAPFVEARQ